MLELICDQTYTWDGVPADKSPYRNHGNAINTDGGSDGAEPGSGIIKFPHSNSRVRIEANPTSVWQRLTALKIEVLARVDPKAARLSVLVAGHGSFRLGLLEGALEARFDNATGSNNQVRSADAFSPDHKRHAVPDNKWVKLGFYHDGFAKMRLFIDDELVGEAIIEGGISPVLGLGVSIGNDVAQDGQQFPGEIDEVRIWRLDPKGMKREFLGRPYSQKTARCWQKEFGKVLEWMKKNPEQLHSLAQQIRITENSFLRSLYLLPDGEQAKLRAVLIAFDDLWFAGKIAGPEMEKVLCTWIALLRALGIDPSGDSAGNVLSAAIAELKIDPYDLLKCDPEIAAFLELLRKAVENCGKTKKVAL
jgi:Concanavalin A-like lectin/glucanases superfamily